MLWIRTYSYVHRFGSQSQVFLIVRLGCITESFTEVTSQSFDFTKCMHTLMFTCTYIIHTYVRTYTYIHTYIQCKLQFTMVMKSNNINNINNVQALGLP